MHTDRPAPPHRERRAARRQRRLAEELAEAGLEPAELGTDPEAVLQELDHALRPPVHERRVPTYGAIVNPEVDPVAWSDPTGLGVTTRATDDLADDDARRFADGLASWALRRAGVDQLVVFDRTAGSERDLVLLADATQATIVQRHPTGVVRAVGTFGLVRWDGMAWHRERPTWDWVETAAAGIPRPEHDTLALLLTFALHDLAAQGIGALLVHRTTDDPPPRWDQRLGAPPPLRIDRPADLAPLRHVLSQVDGAAIFDPSGTLRALGVRLVPSPEAEARVDAYGGTRHISARRYSYDDPAATVIVVSEDGPVTVVRGGQLIGRSDPC